MAVLVISAVMAQAAAAQLAYTCTKGTGFSDSRCQTAGSGPFGHVGIPVGTATSIATSGSLFKLKSVQSGVTLELQATGMTGTGTMENQSSNAIGAGSLTFTGVTVTAPAGHGCVVKGGQVTTTEIAGSTKGLTNEVLFSPNLLFSTMLASIVIESCNLTVLNHAYALQGSVKGQTSGTTITFTHANTTAQGTLTLQGQKAGLEGAATVAGQNGSGLALT